MDWRLADGYSEKDIGVVLSKRAIHTKANANKGGYMTEKEREQTNELLLSFTDVAYVRGGRHILRRVNWQMRRGENWALLGLNGAGKSTLLGMIPAYTFPSKGELIVLGETFGRYPWQKIKERVGFVSAALHQFAGTLNSETLENVVLSGAYSSIGIYREVTEEDRARAKQLVDEFGLGYVGQNPYGMLSAGEQRRTLLARAVMANPDLLVLDEPCSALDIRAREQFLATLEEKANERTWPPFIYVTHRTEEIMPSVTHVAILDDGELVAKGPKKEILTGERLSALYDVPVKVVWEQDRPWLIVTTRS